MLPLDSSSRSQLSHFGEGDLKDERFRSKQPYCLSVSCRKMNKHFSHVKVMQSHNDANQWIKITVSRLPLSGSNVFTTLSVTDLA